MGLKVKLSGSQGINMRNLLKRIAKNTGINIKIPSASASQGDAVGIGGGTATGLRLGLEKSVGGYKIGWPIGARYMAEVPEGGDPTVERDSPLVAEVALQNEFGVPEKRIPERPFFRNANKIFSRRVHGVIVRFAEDGIITKKANEKLAMWHTGLVRKSIKELKEPPNSPTTIALKGSSDPLIDTGLMRRSVTYELID